MDPSLFSYPGPYDQHSNGLQMVDDETMDQYNAWHMQQEAIRAHAEDWFGIGDEFRFLSSATSDASRSSYPPSVPDHLQLGSVSPSYLEPASPSSPPRLDKPVPEHLKLASDIPHTFAAAKSSRRRPRRKALRKVKANDSMPLQRSAAKLYVDMLQNGQQQQQQQQQPLLCDQHGPWLKSDNFVILTVTGMHAINTAVGDTAHHSVWARVLDLD